MVVVTDYLHKHDMAIPKWQVTTAFTVVAYLCSLLYGKFSCFHYIQYTGCVDNSRDATLLFLHHSNRCWSHLP